VAAAPWIKTLVRLRMDATASEGVEARARAEFQNDDDGLGVDAIMGGTIVDGQVRPDRSLLGKESASIVDPLHTGLKDIDGG